MNRVQPITRLLLVLACLVAPFVKANETGAAFEGMPTDSRRAGMGDCLSASRWGATCLSPLPAFEPCGMVAFSYSEPFGLEELAQKVAVCSVPLGECAVTCGFFERGGSVYRERILSASVSAKPVSSVGVSLCPGLYSMSVPGSETWRFFGLGVGARVRPVASLEACIGLENVVTSENAGVLPESFAFALTVTPVSGVAVAAEVRKSSGGLSSLHFGAELESEGGVRLRCGLETAPVQLSAGLSIKLGSLCLETASSFHPVLYRTDMLTLTWAARDRSP